MARYQTRSRPESVLQRDDFTPAPLGNIQPEESATLQPTAATSSGAASGSNQPIDWSASGAIIKHHIHSIKTHRHAYSIKLTCSQATSRFGGSKNHS
eukprot:1849756-Amphidinium_carterae.1